MAHWKNEHKEKIKKLLGNNHCKVAFTGVGNNGTATSEVYYSPEHPDIILGYNSNKQIYYVWNAYLHSTSCMPTISKKIDQSSPILSCYAPTNDGKNNYEKKLIVCSDKIEYFFNHWEELLVPCANDEGFFNGINVLWANRENPEPKTWREEFETGDTLLERERIISERYARDSSFSKKVLQNYDNQCAVCRCRITEVLEAAHIRAVKDFGNDSLGNGICLCRNHHVLYDRHLLKLNSDFTFSTEDERLKNDENFQYIFKRYKGNMHKPKNMEEENEQTNK
jgi:hypothetical protein